MNISETAALISSEVAETAKVFNFARLFDAHVGEGSTIGDYTTLRGSFIGNHCHIQRHCDIMRSSVGDYTCIERMSVAHDVKIGAFCAISWDVSMGGDNHDYLQPTIHPFYYNSVFGIENDPKRKIDQDVKEAEEEPCEIGNDVWIGCGVIVNRGVKIGNGACIGAGSIVTKDVPPYAIVVGVPAKVIKYRFSEDVISRLQSIEWWKWPEDILRANKNLFSSHVDDNMLARMEEITSSLHI